LNPQRIKRLKAHAKKLCADLSIDEKPIFEFIDTGDLYSMLVDIKATFVKYEAGNKTSQLQVLQETLISKDFEISLSNRLLACILSPNITAYVTDTQRHIMDFIADNLEVFKIPPAVFNDNELRVSLGKTVTRLLSDIRSRLKSNLTASIVKKTCIIDVAKAMARASAGMEVDATHWTRLAFLRCCLRLFLIGTGDHKIAPLNACFTPRLIPLLKSDMRAKIEQDLGINIRAMERELSGSAATDGVAVNPTANNDSGSAPTTNNPTPSAELNWDALNDEDGNGDTDGGEDVDTESPSDDDADELDISDSGFGLDGKPIRFNSVKFWNYVDYMLNIIRHTAHKTAATKELYDKELHKYMMQIFQDDLAECPGLRRGSKLVSVVNPVWQSTIQQNLVW
ncbi:hypothetical protein L210DRAFT_817367, partial [Boletus edulis BED1]